jgi:hypothetical protein
VVPFSFQLFFTYAPLSFFSPLKANSFSLIVSYSVLPISAFLQLGVSRFIYASLQLQLDAYFILLEPFANFVILIVIAFIPILFGHRL